MSENIINQLTEDERIDSLVLMLNTPVLRRKLSDEINQLIKVIAKDRNLSLHPENFTD